MPEQSKLCSFFCKKTPPSRFLYSCVFYSDVERQKMLRETDMKNNMDKALEKGEFQVYLQPKIELEHDTIAGAEALVRWHDKEKGGIRSSSSGLRLEAAYKEDNSAGNTTQVKDFQNGRRCLIWSNQCRMYCRTYISGLRNSWMPTCSEHAVRISKYW